MSKTAVDLNKMNNLLASKSAPVHPASDAVQRGSEALPDDKTNSSNDGIVNLSFKVPTGFRKRFKLAAVEAGITQNELVQRALSAWENKSRTA